MDRLLKLAVCGVVLLCAAPLRAQSVNLTIPHAFGAGNAGQGPTGGLVQAPDGSFYGTTSDGGGTIFRLVPAADPAMPATVTDVHSFNLAQGWVPRAGLIRAFDGSYYGTTALGGDHNLGTIFRMVVSAHPVTGNLVHVVTTLHSFDGTEGATPLGSLVEIPDEGAFYGTTSAGGASGGGTIFRLQVVPFADGSVLPTMQTLVHLDMASGLQPQAGLILASDGYFYGTASEGGALGSGTLFRLEVSSDPVTGELVGLVTALHDFGGSERNPYTALIQAPDGAFYGTTIRGGASNVGTVFRYGLEWDPATFDWSVRFRVLHEFATATGATPLAALVRGSNGAFYGTTVGDQQNIGATLFRLLIGGDPMTGPVTALVTVLHSFDMPTTGEAPGGLHEAADGSFYGTALGGGAHGGGTVYRFVDPQVIPTITWPPPFGVPYGTSLSSSQLNAVATVGGVEIPGTYTYSPPAGAVLNPGDHELSVVFTPDDTNTYASATGAVTLHVGKAMPFLSWGVPAPILDGTALSDTQLSAIAFSGTQVPGTYVYTPPSGTVLPPGRHLLSVVFTPDDPNFYDSASKTVPIVVYLPTVPATSPVKLLYSFPDYGTPNTSAGTGPVSALFQGSDGRYYGTTPYGGTYLEGTVFRMDATGAVTTLHSFATPGLAFPYAGLVQGPDGLFYGATYTGGPNGYGGVYRLDPAATPAVTPLHEFSPAEGGGPYLSTPTFGSDGRLYGATLFGSGFGVGGFYQLDLGTPVPTFRSLGSLTDAQGINPWPSLLEAGNGWFYVPVLGGTPSTNGGILRVDAAGTIEVVVSLPWNNGYVNGRGPVAPLARGTDGFLYGSTFMGGGIGPGIWTCGGFGCGTLFRLDPASGTLTTLHTFTGLDGMAMDGAGPVAGLFQARDGYFYGTTSEGGTSGIGTIFRFDPTEPISTDPATGWVTNAVEVLHSFDGRDGATPWAALIQGTDDAIYGVARAGGTLAGGSIFRFKVPTVDWAPGPVAEGTPLGAAQLNATAAFAGVNVPGTFTYAPPAGTVLPAGTHRLSVRFEPTDTSTYFPARRSVVVTVGTIPTVTTLTASPNPSLAPQAVTLIATVANAGGASPVPTGVVTFTDTTTHVLLGSATLDASGQATIVLSAGTLAVGTHTLEASYAGDASHAASRATVEQIVNSADTTLVLTVSSPAYANQPVTFTAVVTALGHGVPSGLVTFEDIGSGASQSAALDALGRARVMIPLPVGAYEYRARYLGDGLYHGSEDTGIFNVQLAPTVTTLATSPNPSAFGQPVTLTAAVSSSSGPGPTPTGSVTFRETATNTTLGSVTLDGAGMATLVTSALALGTNIIEANYGGDALYVASAGGKVHVVEDRTAPTVAIDQAAGQADPTNGSPILFRVTFSEPVSGFAAGDVSFAGSTVGGTLLATVSGSGAVYTVSVTGMNGAGIVRAAVVAGAAQDAAGNPSTASTSTDNTVSFDNARPGVTVNQAAGQADPTTGATIAFTAVFDEPVTGFTGADISFAGSTVGGTLAPAVSGSGPTYTVTVTGMTGTGTVVVSVPAGAATDALGNPSQASTSTDNVVTVNPLTRPDLREFFVWSINAARRGTSITAIEIAVNLGTAPAGASATRLYLSRDAVLDAADVALAVRSVPGLGPGAVSFGILTATIPNATVPGSYFLIVAADADRTVAESNETNNTDARAFTVR